MAIIKLSRIGNSTGLTLPVDILREAKMARGDSVSVEVRNGRIEIARAEGDYAEAMDKGRTFAGRYRRTMADLAK
jgi:antitoxin MazE